MAIRSIISVLSILLLAHTTRALQVTPNSPCASVCLDSPTQDVSDPNASNTYGSDIVCSNAGYQNTPIGMKFESCVSCLQNSTASSSGENDQGWFLYNLRFALDSCLFGFSNATDITSSPCSTATSCGPLQQALEDGNLDPSNETEYSYCSADDHSFLGSSLPKCISCLQDASEASYLANFLIALEAGCVQRPVVGMNIGLQGTVFSTTPVNITFPGDSPASATKGTTHKHGLAQGVIIGIAVGIGLLLVLVAAIAFIWQRKRRHLKSMKRLTSPLDSRFGSKTISSPNSGAYGNPYASPPVSASLRFEPSALSSKEPQYPTSRDAPDVEGWQDAHAHLSVTQLPPPYAAPAAIPTHLAYIPSSHMPVSPAASDGTSISNSYQMSPYPSARSSPRNPPPIQIPQARAQTPQQAQPSQLPLRAEVSPRQDLSPLHPQQQEPSQISRAGLHSQQHTVDRCPPLRANSVSRGWRRNRSTSRPGLRDTNASMDVPVKISGPMIEHSSRFDFELADRERMEREEPEGRRTWRRPDQTPSSAESEEQWPGAY